MRGLEGLMLPEGDRRTLAGSAPLWPLVFLVLGIVSFLEPVIGLLFFPYNATGIILFAFAPIAGMIFLILFYNTFYFVAGRRPTLLERMWVWRCPYCGARRGRVVDRALVGEEQTRTTQEIIVEGAVVTSGIGTSAFTDDGVFGTKAPGREKPMVPRHFDAEILNFREHLRCSKCGKSWTRTVLHEMRAPQSSHADDSAPEFTEPGSPDY